MSKDIHTDEERRIVHEILEQQKEWILGTGGTTHYAFTEDLLVYAIKAHTQQAIDSFAQSLKDGYGDAHLDSYIDRHLAQLTTTKENK